MTVVVTSEQPAETPVDAAAVTASGDAAVEIATIEAERDIKLAEIAAENSEAITEALVDEDDNEWLEAQLGDVLRVCADHAMAQAAMAEQINRLETMLTSLLILIPLPPEETQEQTAEATEEPESVAEAGQKESREEPAVRRPRYL